MSKRKSRHRIPIERLRLTDEVTPEYQAEVDRHTERLERRSRNAEQALARAQQHADRIAGESVSRAKRAAHESRLSQALAQVEIRRAELEEYRQLMAATDYASTRHRGRDSYRPVPITYGKDGA